MEDAEVDLRNVLGLLRRQVRLIIASVIVVVTLAGLVTFSFTPIYSATALILVDPSRKNLLDPDAQIGSGVSDSARIDSEVEILRSDNVLLKVIEAENLTSDVELGASLSLRERILTLLRLYEPQPPTAAEALHQVLNNLRNAVSIQRRGLTYLISVQGRSPDSGQAARIANAVAGAYIEDQVAAKVASTLSSRDILQARIQQARDAITASESAFDGFIDGNVARIATEIGRPDLVQTRQQIAQLEANRRARSQQADAAQADLASADWDALVASLQSSALAELARQRSELAGRPATEVTDLSEQLAALDIRLRDTASVEVAGLRNAITAAQQQEAELRQQLRQSVLDSALPAAILTDLYGLRQNAELARNQYQLLLSRLQDLETQADLQVADSRIVSPALPPQFPDFPNRPLIMALAGLVAIGLGIALAFLYENFIGGFTSEAQLGSVLKTRVASAIPRQKARPDKESLANLMVAAPLSVFAESVRRLRATLQQTLRSKEPQAEDKGRVIMISSTAPGEGKTTLALSLARSYALSGSRTLLIDCDLRKPSLHRHLGLEPSHGLLEFLDGNEREGLTPIISADTMTDATFIVGAHRSDVPTDQLLTGQSFARLMRAARHTFDVVILDTPPVGPVVDALYVAPVADVIVFVTRWVSTSQLDAKEALASLAEAKAPGTEIVAIINQQDRTRASYLRKYGAYYAEQQ
ncbi:MAG TPA: Wzz/FepE/Etk N-terminal domain-containing protein [Devosia sp.]|nr:Wzz/FepE/Etk N-terminal domain-containing protein [Devosia sp.]